MAKWFWSGSVAIGTGGQLLVTGTGDPEGVVTAPIGSLYLRVDGAANHAIYIKESGIGTTGWTAIGGAGTSVTLRHNNISNSSQNNLNLVDGNGTTVVDLGGGAIQINGANLKVDGITLSAQTGLDIRSGSGVTVTDLGLGRVSISTATSPVTLKINGVDASGLNPINLVSGTDISISDQGAGSIKIDATFPGAPTAVDTTKTTALLNPLSGTYTSSNTESGFVNLDKGGTLLKVVADRAARVRLYTTAAARDADLTRSNTTPPTPGTQHGVLADLFLDGVSAPLTWLLLPAVLHYNGDFPTQTDKIYYNITNISAASHTVAVTFTHVQEES